MRAPGCSVYRVRVRRMLEHWVPQQTTQHQMWYCNCMACASADLSRELRGLRLHDAAKRSQRVQHLRCRHGMRVKHVVRHGGPLCTSNAKHVQPQLRPSLALHHQPLHMEQALVSASLSSHGCAGWRCDVMFWHHTRSVLPTGYSCCHGHDLPLACCASQVLQT